MKGVDQRQGEMVSAGHMSSRGVARQRESQGVGLGVKWSQVQILSARPENTQFRGISPDSTAVNPLPLWGFHFVVPMTCGPSHRPPSPLQIRGQFGMAFLVKVAKRRAAGEMSRLRAQASPTRLFACGFDRGM